MSWFEIVKIYRGDESEYLPKEVYSLLDDLKDLDDKYRDVEDEINSEAYDILDKLLEIAKQEKDDKYMVKGIEKFMREGAIAGGDFESLYHTITDEYQEKKSNQSSDGYVSPTYGNKNAKAVESMKDFTDEYYENPYSDPEENRELTAFIAGVSNGESISELERKYPGAYIVFDSAGLLNEVEE